MLVNEPEMNLFVIQNKVTTESQIYSAACNKNVLC